MSHSSTCPNYGVATDFLQQSDPILGKVISKIGLCQLKPSSESDLISAIAQGIISQQISTIAASAIYQRFLQLYTDYGSTEEKAKAILETPEEKLREAGISRPKIRYLKDLAQKTLSDLPTLEQLETKDDQEIIEIVTQVKGVGNWTAQMLLMFSLNRQDVLPIDDLGVRKAIKNLYNLTELPTRLSVEELGNKWKPYRSIACWYLWKSLELEINKNNIGLL
ncbi:MAG: DNA-3-methyladenine glycosylase 2 family protein [Symploca sp. SIO2G7]|nr:DNA-3-methyladenine glycosylase 2 family protein [Symploca sp. SIO2G7]